MTQNSLFASISNLPCHPDVLQQMQYEHYDHPPIALHQFHTRVPSKYKPNKGTNNYNNKPQKKEKIAQKPNKDNNKLLE
jgi:hypothetical protein